MNALEIALATLRSIADAARVTINQSRVNPLSAAKRCLATLAAIELQAAATVMDLKGDPSVEESPVLPWVGAADVDAPLPPPALPEPIQYAEEESSSGSQPADRGVSPVRQPRKRGG